MMDALDILFPRRCPVCRMVVRPTFKMEGDKPMPEGEVGKLICPHCYGKLPFISGPTCLSCGKHISEPGRELCPECTVSPKNFKRGVSLLDYSNRCTDRLMWDIKYNNKREYADLLALELARRYATKIDGWRCEVIVPVPIHASKMRTRGYNQAAIVAERLGEIMDLPVDCDALKRVVKTRPQKENDPEERKRNLRDAFRAGKSASYYKNVCLLDDIYTTGATMEACTRELLGAGVKNVYIVSCSIV